MSMKIARISVHKFESGGKVGQTREAQQVLTAIKSNPELNNKINAALKDNGVTEIQMKAGSIMVYRNGDVSFGTAYNSARITDTNNNDTLDRGDDVNKGYVNASLAGGSLNWKQALEIVNSGLKKEPTPTHEREPGPAKITP
jgi:hypothetical protein